MTGFDQFLSVFGDFSINRAVEVILALAFLFVLIKKMIVNLRMYLEEKMKTEEETKEQMNRILEATNLLPEIQDEIRVLQEQQKKSMDRLDKIEEERRHREQNSIRDRLLQSYRYYTNPERNPLGQWTQLEYDAFMELYRDYLNIGGNGYVHSDVKPVMDKLIVVEMTDSEGVANLMQSRK